MQNFKVRLKALPFKEKLVLAGGIFVSLGAFLPWYRDIDKFRTGDTFLGITGPLYLAGLIVLACGLISFAVIMAKLLDKRHFKLPVQEAYIHFGGAGFSILMIILTTSVYFHPKFGINLTEKSLGIGMILSMIGVGGVILGSVLAIKKRDVNFESEGKLEPLIEINDRVQGDISTKPDIEISERKSSPFEIQKSINSFLEAEKPSTTDINKS
ncbi:MAG: hypothetical protein PHP74_01980 [Candidatus Gracilibacteria bacterium]|nr:hypothetical protein [Candidatus Gracilibacteria bacterium]